MATLTRTASGRWKALIRRRGWPAVARTYRLKRDAINWARHTEDEMVLGRYRIRPAADNLLFSSAIDRYLNEVTPRKSPTTHATDRYRADILARFFGRYYLEAIGPELVARFRDERSGTSTSRNRTHPPAPRQPLSPASVRLELILLSHVFTVARREWQTGPIVNPVSQIRLPSPSPGRTRRLSRSEERRVFRRLAHFPNPMLGWIFRLALETAMRAAEISTLTLPQIDFAQRTILLTTSKNGCARTIPLSRTATWVLRSAVALRTRPANCPLVFFGQSSADGCCQSYRFQDAWGRLRSELGLDDFRFHDLRHEAISRLVEVGLGDLEVAAISGHKAMQMLKRYTHLRAEQLVKKLDRLDRRAKPPTRIRKCT